MESRLHRAVQKLALAGEQAGLHIEDMISLLNDGVTVEALLDLMELRPKQQDSRRSPAQSLWIC
jgi:hypothetical protein